MDFKSKNKKNQTKKTFHFTHPNLLTWGSLLNAIIDKKQFNLKGKKLTFNSDYYTLTS